MGKHSVRVLDWLKTESVLFATTNWISEQVLVSPLNNAHMMSIRRSGSGFLQRESLALPPHTRHIHCGSCGHVQTQKPWLTGCRRLNRPTSDMGWSFLLIYRKVLSKPGEFYKTFQIKKVFSIKLLVIRTGSLAHRISWLPQNTKTKATNRKSTNMPQNAKTKATNRNVHEYANIMVARKTALHVPLWSLSHGPRKSLLHTWHGRSARRSALWRLLSSVHNPLHWCLRGSNWI